MTDADRIADVLRLTSALVDRVLDAQANGRSVSDDQHRALVQAADLLRDYDIAPPPMLEQALHGLTGAPASEATRSEKQPAADGDLGIFEEIARALTGLRKG